MKIFLAAQPWSAEFKLAVSHLKNIRIYIFPLFQTLHWYDHVNNIAVNLNRVNAILLKIRSYVNMKTLRNMYFAIFDSFHLFYIVYIHIYFIQTHFSFPVTSWNLM